MPDVSMPQLASLARRSSKGAYVNLNVRGQYRSPGKRKPGNADFAARHICPKSFF